MKKTDVLIVLATLSAGVVLVSNLAATKLFDLGGVAVDGGIVLFPLSYILGDVVVELFGRRRARTVIYAGLIMNLLAVAALAIVGQLPPYPGWENQAAYDAILGFMPRIVGGSLAAFVASSLLNNLVFEKIKQRTGQKWLAARTIGSSLVAHLVDALIFETVAFYGVLPFDEFVTQAAFAYVAGLGLEVLLTPITYLVVKGLRGWAKI